MKNILIALLLWASYIFASIDINHANINELTKLNGVGSAKAQAIISYIKENGCFKKLEDLKAVKGIGEKTILKNKENIEISPCK